MQASDELIRIEPPVGLQIPDLRELWEYRGLIGRLAQRDLQLRYKQTVAGVVWVAIQPLLSALLLGSFFGRWLAPSTGRISYVLFAFCGFVPWTYFVHGLTVGTYSVVKDQALVTKIRFPHMALPIGQILAGLVNLFITLLVLAILMLRSKVAPDANSVTLPLFVLLTFITTTGVALWLSALEVYYRDIDRALPFFTQLWFFATPVAYSIDVVPHKWRWLYCLNPMVGVVTGFRWCIFGTPIGGSVLLASIGISLLVLVSGMFFFRALEDKFADVI